MKTIGKLSSWLFVLSILTIAFSFGSIAGFTLLFFISLGIWLLNR